MTPHFKVVMVVLCIAVMVPAVMMILSIVGQNFCCDTAGNRWPGNEK